MTKQIIFAITLLVTLGVFALTIRKIVSFFRFTRPAFPVKDLGKRFGVMMTVAFGQTKIFREPVIGFFHALVFWGFCIIIFGSIEMVIDVLTGTERVLQFLGPVYNILMASGDVFALLVAISITATALKPSKATYKVFSSRLSVIPKGSKPRYLSMRRSALIGIWVSILWFL